jgi:hypothetical protein
MVIASAPLQGYIQLNALDTQGCALGFHSSDLQASRQ